MKINYEDRISKKIRLYDLFTERFNSIMVFKKDSFWWKYNYKRLVILLKDLVVITYPNDKDIEDLKKAYNEVRSMDEARFDKIINSSIFKINFSKDKNKFAGVFSTFMSFYATIRVVINVSNSVFLGAMIVVSGFVAYIIRTVEKYIEKLVYKQNLETVLS